VTIRVLKEFPDPDTLIKTAVAQFKQTETDEESLYQEAIMLMLRVADKSERLCIEDPK